MSKIKQLILESAYEALVEAPTKQITPAQANDQQQPETQSSGGYQIKASGHQMQKYAGENFYFLKFETEQDGSKRPLFLDAEDKNLAATFPSEQEAKQMIDTIYREAPLYKTLFQNITVIPENEPDNSTNTSSTENPEQTQDQPIDEPQKQKFKDWLNQQKQQVGQVFQQLNDTGKDVVAATSKVLAGEPTGNETVDNLVTQLKDTIKKLTPDQPKKK